MTRAFFAFAALAAVALTLSSIRQAEAQQESGLVMGNYGSVVTADMMTNTMDAEADAGVIRELGKKGYYKPKKAKKTKKSKKSKKGYTEPAKVIAVPVPMQMPQQKAMPMQSSKGYPTQQAYGNNYQTNYNNGYSNGYNSYNGYNDAGYYRRQLKEYSAPATSSVVYTPVQHVPTANYVPVQQVSKAPVVPAQVVTYKPVVQPVEQKYVKETVTKYVPETTTKYVADKSYVAQPAVSYVSQLATTYVKASESPISHATLRYLHGKKGKKAKKHGKGKGKETTIVAVPMPVPAPPMNYGKQPVYSGKGKGGYGNNYGSTGYSSGYSTGYDSYNSGYGY